ncbi:MAG: hypothetical protein ACR2PS_04005, partial [Pseudomonadales bacterium]
MSTLLQRLFFGGSLRYKLLSLVLVPLLLLAGTLIYLSAKWYSDYTYQQLFAKVNTDLRVAHDIFRRIETDRQREIASLGDSARFRQAIDRGEPDVLTDLLVAHRLQHGLDFLNLLSSDGSKRLTRDGWVSSPLKQSPLTDEVLRVVTSVPRVAAGIE